jgi:hypothetical protein
MPVDQEKEPPTRFVLGLDLDGECADFYGKMREITAEWRDVDEAELDPNVSFGLPEWGVRPPAGNDPGEYERIHRFAVTQRNLFDCGFRAIPYTRSDRIRTPIPTFSYTR